MASNDRLYQSPPGSGGNDGTIPQTYDPSWQTYTNLTQAQISAFQAFPQDLLLYASQSRWLKEIAPLTVTVGVNTFPVDMNDRSLARVASIKAGAVAITNFLARDGKIYQIGAPQAGQIHAAMYARIENTYNVLNTLFNGINATPPTITARAQIDSAFAVVT